MFTPEERRRRGGQLDPALSSARRREVLVLHEDRPLERLQRGPGLDSDLPDERVARGAILREGVRLAAVPVESEHQLRPSALPQRLGCDEGLEPRDQLLVASEGDLGISEILERAEAELLQPCGLVRGERQGGDPIGVRPLLLRATQ